MLTEVSRKMAKVITQGNTEIQYEEEVYVYGIEIILSTLITMLSIMLISFLISKPYLGVVFIVVFCPLRIFSGAYHAETYFKCFVLSNVYFLLVLMLCKVLETGYSMICLSIVVWISIFHILKEAPIVHPNHSISKKKQELCRKYLRGVMAVEILLGVIFIGMGMFELLKMEILTIILVAVLTVKIRKEVEHNEYYS